MAKTTTSGGNHGMSPWIGWGISTLLLLFLNRSKGKDGDTSSQQPSKFTDTNVNSIGTPVPVVLGRCLIKNPLISYYGDFRADPYTEEYGMHSKLNVWGFLFPLLLSLIMIVSQKDSIVVTAGTGTEIPSGADEGGVIGRGITIPSNTKLIVNPGIPVVTSMGGGTTSGPGTVTGTIEYAETGKKRAQIVNVIAQLIIWLLLQLFNKHMGRTTIQKGFKYYLGWQHIICWTGKNIGIKQLWMNVYDSEVESSIETGVWDNDSHVAWKKDNINGITAHIDQPDMFGGVDEGGGFIGDVRFYFGNRIQPKDTWMIRQMTISENIPTEQKGLTPKYPMYLTCVISNSDYESGSYIGKQATVPEMWFEVVNYPSRLGDYWKKTIIKKFANKLNEEYDKVVQYIKSQSPLVQEYMRPSMEKLDNAISYYQDSVLDYQKIPTWSSYIDSLQLWKVNTSYKLSDIIVYSRNRYICLVNHTSTDFDNDLTLGYWRLLEQSDFMTWESGKDYVIGDVIEYLGQIYTCTFYLQPSNLKLKIFDNRNSFYDENWELYDTGLEPSPTLLDDIYEYANDVYNYFPPTDKDIFGATLQGLMDLCKNGVWHLGILDYDLNPSEAIYEILVNDYWGCNYQEDRIDIESLIDLGITCEREGIGVSCLINRVSQANEYITKILDHINGVKYDNPTTGKLCFKLIRNDYDIDNIKSFDISNCESCEFSRLDWSETTSAISMNFIDADNKYDTGQFLQTDISNRLITGSYTEKQVDGTYFTTTTNAKWLAQTSLLSAGYPLAAVNLVTNRDAYTVTIGEPIKVSWEPYGISNMVFRVTDINYATLKDGKISITAVEDVFGFDKLDYDFSSTPMWTDPEKEPFDIARYLFMEEPYELSMSLDTYLYAYAAQPSNYTIYWDCWRYISGNYSRTSQSSIWSTVGRIVYGYDEKYDFDPTGFEFSYVGTNGKELIDNKVNAIDSDPYTYNRNSSLNLVVIDDEIMSYDSIVKLPNGNYQMKGIVRGIYDTIPKNHTAESIMYFIEYRMNVNGSGVIVRQGNNKEEQLELRTETADKVQDFDISLIENFYTTRRSEQPSIMANLKFGSDKGTETDYYYNIPTTQKMSYDLLFNFIGRNKFDVHGILEQTDDTTIVNVNEDTQNVLKVYCNEVEFEYKWDARDTTVTPNVNITEFKLKWADFCKEMGNRLSDANTVLLTIKTYDKSKDLYSYDGYKKTINYVVPRLAGIVTSASDVQSFANTLVQPSTNNIVLPETTVSPQITLTFEDCALIFVGTTPATGSTGLLVIGQDGLTYDLTTEAYRIDGYDSYGNAIVHEITIEEEFVFRTNYTVLIDNRADYFRYRLGNYISYIPYTYIPYSP